MFNKFLALVLAVTLLAAVTPTARAETAGTQDDKLKQAVEVLTSLGIFNGDEDGTNDFDSTVTRAQMAVYITRMLGLSDVLDGSSTLSQYSDVKEDYFAFANINTVSKLGIFKGFEDGSFRPEEPVSYEQAIKMLVSVLGYDVYAMNKGGYPVGYLVVAADKKLTKDIAGDAGAAMTKGTLVQLLYNALDVDLMEASAFGSNTEYTIQSGKTLLSEKLKVVKKTGVVTAVKNTRLNNGIESGLKNDEVEIEGTVLKAGKTNALELLGYKVDYYYKEDSQTKDNVLLNLQTEDYNQAAVVLSDDISSASTKKTFAYWKDKDKDDKVEELAINYENASVIKNDTYLGKIYSDDVPDDIMSKASSVKLIDNDHDSRYDVVMVYNYETYVVDQVNTESHKIHDKYDVNKVLTLDPDDNQCVIAIRGADGKVIKFEDIVEWNVLSVAEGTNAGKKMVNVLVSTQKVTGKVSEIGSDHKIKIEDKEYKIADSFTKTLNLDDQGDFYLDIQNKIAGFSKGSGSDEVYGYLFKVARGEGISSTCEFQFIDEYGDAKTYKGAEKIKMILAGEDIGSQNAEDILTQFTSQGKTVMQLVKYKLNADGNVSEIEKPSNLLNQDYSKDAAFAKYYAGNAPYNNDLKCFAGKYRVSPDTKIFTVPDVPLNDSISADEIKKLRSAFVHDNTNYKNNIEVYDITEDFKAQAVVNKKALVTPDSSVAIEDSLTSVFVGMTIAVFDKITTAIDDVGEKRLKLHYWQGGSMKSIFIESPDIYYDPGNAKNHAYEKYWNVPVTSDIYGGYKNGNVRFDRLYIDPAYANNTNYQALQKGDIIQFTINMNYNVCSIRPIYLARTENISDDVFFEASSTSSTLPNIFDDFYTAFGTLKKQFADSVKIQVGSEKNVILQGRMAGVNVCIVDTKKNTVSKGTLEDLNADDKVFACSKYVGLLTDIVIYR